LAGERRSKIFQEIINREKARDEEEILTLKLELKVFFFIL
jgi:hypothetical protein